MLLTLIDEESDGSPIVQKLENASADVISDIEAMDKMLNQRLPRSIKLLISKNDASDSEKNQEAKKAFSLDALSARNHSLIFYKLLASIEADHGSFWWYVGQGRKILEESHRSSKSIQRDKEPELVKLKSDLAALENTSENLPLTKARAEKTLNELEDLIQHCHDPTEYPTARQLNLGPLCSEVDVSKLKESFAKRRAKYLAFS
ncbi:MAG: hypothetical protein Q9198_001000 [Flavoplaca austrocitrina]